MKPDETINQDDSVAERHVTEIMGPTDSLPVKEESEPIVIKPSAPVVEVETPEPLPVMTSAPEVTATIPEVSDNVAASSSDIVPEADVKLPEATSALADTTTDTGIDEAIDDITRSDADKLLPPESEDTAEPVVMKSSLGERIKQAYFKWWDNKIARYVTLGVIAVLVGVALFVQPVRSAALNLCGVRTSISVTAIDNSTSLPLKNAVLNVGDKQVKTNGDGYAKLYGIRLGTQEIQLQKAGFATNKRSMVLGMRTVDLGEVELKAVGTQYTFVLTDYFSGKTVKDVDVSSGEATTVSDSSGKAVLTVQPSDDSGNLNVVVEKKGYRTEKLSISRTITRPTTLKLVPSPKEVYVSKESGKYDLYKMDLDGKNKKVLLAGTGLETSAISVSVDATGSHAALVSTRDDKRNKDGYLLSALTIVNVATGDSDVIEHAEQITLLGWSGTSIVYQQTVAGASAANASRQKIMSYDYSTSKRIQIANANYFSGAVLVGDKVYYVVSSTDPNVEGSFVRSDVDATNKKTLQTGEIWQLYRADYKTLNLQTSTAWYEYKIGATALTKTTPPVSYASRKYIDSTDGKSSAWVDSRDANGALMIYNVANGKDKQLTIQKGMTDVVRWVNETVVIYRTVSASEVTEYAVSVNGGSPQSLTTVSAVY